MVILSSPNDGLYLFSLSTVCFDDGRDVDIMFNNETVAASRCHYSHFDQGNAFVVMECKINEKVWVKVAEAGTLHGNSTEMYTSFSGFQCQLN